MFELSITFLKEILDYNTDTGIFIWKRKKAGVRNRHMAGCKDHGYIRIMINRKKYYAHQLAWYYMTGEWVDEIDHKNTIKDDNRWDNLRLSTHSQNLINRKKQKNNKSGFKGVYWQKDHNKWCSRINCIDKTHFIGYFNDPIEAAKAYDKKAIEFFGEFAKLNFPNKINYHVTIMSDLHLEFYTLKNIPKGDILILAGDIFIAAHMHKFHTDARSRSEKKKYEKFCKEELSKYKHILYVKGNHEHYQGNFENTSSILKEYLSLHAPNLTLLDNESIIIVGVKFIGSSCWSTYGCNTAKHMIIQEGMNDCHVIKTQLSSDDDYTDEFTHKIHGRKFNVFDINKEHEKSIKYIENELEAANNLPCIVITHHAPSYMSLMESRNMDDAYCSNQHKLIEKYKPKMWIHGHTHDTKKYKINETIIISNQRGYFGMERCARTFDPSAADFNLEDIRGY
jgi:Icc-related predicted phosphoesterase